MSNLKAAGKAKQTSTTKTPRKPSPTGSTKSSGGARSSASVKTSGSVKTGGTKSKSITALNAPTTKSVTKPVAGTAVTISFGPHAIASVVSAKSKKIIEEVMVASGVKAVTISSTLRNAKDQARAMYDNLSAPGGVANAKKLYKAAGQKIIAVYEQEKKEGKTAQQIKTAMENKINMIGAEVVTKHAKDPSKINVIDIAPSSIPSSKRLQFVARMKDAKKQGNVSLFLEPGQGDPAYHIEIVQ